MKLTIEGITKKFGNKVVLNNFSIELQSGVYGLLGPNGAGKTTLINIIVGILKADFGNVKLDEVNVKELGYKYLEKVGYLPQAPRFYKNFRGREFLMYMCAIKGLASDYSKKRTDELLRMVNLWEERDKKIGAYSGGMRQRLGIAQALLNDPEVLILDEPTAGLDPKERIRFRNIISKLSSNKIVLLATHIVSDVEYIAKEVVLIKQGKLITAGRPAGLIEELKGKVWGAEVLEENIADTLERYSISNAAFMDKAYSLRIVSDEKPMESAVSITPNLEDVYIYNFRDSVVS